MDILCSVCAAYGKYIHAGKSVSHVLCVYANGMMAALIFVYIANNLRHGRYSGIFFTGLAIFSLYFIRIMLKYNLAYKSGGQEQVWQVQNRFALSLMFTLLIIGAAFSFKWLRWIFSNRVMRFLSGISFNLYIWHQVICLRLKEWKSLLGSGKRLSADEHGQRVAVEVYGRDMDRISCICFFSYIFIRAAGR